MQIKLAVGFAGREDYCSSNPKSKQVEETLIHQALLLNSGMHVPNQNVDMATNQL